MSLVNLQKTSHLFFQSFNCSLLMRNAKRISSASGSDFTKARPDGKTNPERQ